MLVKVFGKLGANKGPLPLKSYVIILLIGNTSTVQFHDFKNMRNHIKFVKLHMSQHHFFKKLDYKGSKCNY